MFFLNRLLVMKKMYTTLFLFRRYCMYICITEGKSFVSSRGIKVEPLVVVVLRTRSILCCPRGIRPNTNEKQDLRNRCSIFPSLIVTSVDLLYSFSEEDAKRTLFCSCGE